MKTIDTEHKFFNENGYLLLKNVYNADLLYDDVPKTRGMITYHGSEKKMSYAKKEEQVPGSLARYSHPKYKEAHSNIRKTIESVIGKKLYNTYYYDRFYFPGQDLKKHVDRHACEISISVNISSNLKKPWAFCIKTPYGETRSIEMEPGDGVLYKGCDCLHWRDPMPSKYPKILSIFDDSYYHQIFFHYVLADGYRCEFANDGR